MILVLLIVIATSFLCAGERVHFRIHMLDQLDHNTRTRTVFLKPNQLHSWTDPGVQATTGAFHHGYFNGVHHPHRDPPPPLSLRPMSFIRQTVQVGPSIPVAVGVHPVFRRPPNHNEFRPSPQEPPKVSAPIKAQPAQSAVKKGCRSFINSNGEEVSDGNCYLEEYEKGYNQEESNKTFYGDGRSNLDTVKEGERNTKKYNKEHQYEHHPKIRHEWVETPDGKVHLLRTKVYPNKLFPGSKGVVRVEAPYLVKVKDEEVQSNEVYRPNHVKIVRVHPLEQSAQSPRKVPEDVEGVSDSSELGPDREIPTEIVVEDGFQSAGRDVQDEDAEYLNPVTEYQNMESVRDSRRVVPERWISPTRSSHPKAELRDHISYDVYKPLTTGKVLRNPAQEESVPFHYNKAYSRRRTPVQPSPEWTFNPVSPRRQNARELNTETFTVSTLPRAYGGTQVQRRGPAEKQALMRNANLRLGLSQESSTPEMGAILASNGHVFNPQTPLPPHPESFGVMDPDRLEASRRAPVVSHVERKRSGLKVKQEHQQQTWR